MLDYLRVIIVGAASGIILLLAFRVWFNFLVSLAKKYDIEKRRKIANLVYIFLVIPIYLSIMVSDIYLLMSVGKFNRNFSGLILVLSLLPAIIWYFRKLSFLRSIGYGPQGRNNK